MSPSTLSIVSLAAFSITSVLAQTETFPAVPLASKHFEYPNEIPYKVDTDTNLIRGFQTGYNICNSTTEGPESLCQTSFLNGPDDFCLWAPKDPDSVIADTEGEEVAWCTKPGHGTRLIPAGALKGIQFMKTPDYVQIVGFIDQTKINIKAGDYGGELDPHGADLRGNPMGGLMYSNAFSGDNKYQQVIEWTNFMGGDAFCIKACDPAGPNAAHFCEHIFDRIGCVYNMPNQAKNGTFESCLGENQDYPGVYTDEAGAVQTYKQPGETEVPNPTYTPKMPASSSCTTFASETLFAALGTPTAQSSGHGGASATGSNPGSKPTGTGKPASGSAAAAGAAPTGSDNGAMTLSLSAISVAGVIFSALFLS
jgi:hypothetical protein